MKVLSRPLNVGETFCTSIKKAKAVFNCTDIKLCFGAFSRYYNPYENEFGYYYYKKNIHGTVVAQIILHPGVTSPLLKFYVLKSTLKSTQLKSEFEDAVLQKLFTMYRDYCSGQPSQQRSTIIWVELLDDSFIIHQFTP